MRCVLGDVYVNCIYSIAHYLTLLVPSTSLVQNEKGGLSADRSLPMRSATILPQGGVKSHSKVTLQTTFLLLQLTM